MKLSDNHVDDHVDEEIKQCFLSKPPQSFFMFAGAGSGKTRSLINALSFINQEGGRYLSTNAKQVAVITYTNAACDEICRRLQYRDIFAVSTIHSFLWELIKDYQDDIRQWLVENIRIEIGDLREKQAKGRAGKAAIKREEDIRKKTERLSRLAIVRRFSYNPNGENVGYDSLNHSEVVKMGAEFIRTENTMQEILVNKYPLLMIDESQDTKKELVDALLVVYERFKDRFLIGMFGDTMQKIYMDGKENLQSCIPNEWKKPVKVMNHRSAKRIVELANNIRGTIDNQRQQYRSDAEKGFVRLFIADSFADKKEVENRVAEIMANAAGDDEWKNDSSYKSLILEHHMAASRFGFDNIYTPLDESKKFDTSLRDGSISEIAFLANIISPLITAYQEGNDFEVARIVRRHSPLLDKKALANKSIDQLAVLEKSEKAVESLALLWENNTIPSCLDVLKSIKDTGLFRVNSRVDDILDSDSNDEKIIALRKSLSARFDELEKYSAYVREETRFATHQGIKGLEYPRVMVIMDDGGARGFLFSYEKLFGAQAKTDADIRNENEGKDTSIKRTTRLFYVACTRSQSSLAVIAYTVDKEAVMSTAALNGWFKNEEIVVL